jgi:hypothetical protein
VLLIKLRIELDTPTIARVVPREKRWRAFWLPPSPRLWRTRRTMRKLAYIRLNIPAPSAFAQAMGRQVPASWRCFVLPKPWRRRILVDQGRGFAGMFHPSTSSSLSVRDATAPAMPATGNQKQIGGARRLFNTGTPPPVHSPVYLINGELRTTKLRMSPANFAASTPGATCGLKLSISSPSMSVNEAAGRKSFVSKPTVIFASSRSWT